MVTSEKSYDLKTARLIQKAYDEDEFIPIILYGPLGWGKSSFAIKCLALILGDFKEYDYEAVKEYVVFHPREFLKKCQEMPLGERKPALIWDDAGVWLYAMDFSNPLIKSIGKYLNVARTDWASIIFTTPWPNWVVKRVRGLPQSVMIKVTKVSSGAQYPGNARPYQYKNRLATAYHSWMAPDLKKSGVRKIHTDGYSAYLPDDFYWDWYKPHRDKYATAAKEMMREALEKLDLIETPLQERKAIENELSETGGV